MNPMISYHTILWVDCVFPFSDISLDFGASYVTVNVSYFFLYRKMNVEMSDAIYTDGNGHSFRLDNFHVMGRKIRYVHIPDQVSC